MYTSKRLHQLEIFFQNIESQGDSVDLRRANPFSKILRTLRVCVKSDIDYAG